MMGTHNGDRRIEMCATPNRGRTVHPRLAHGGSAAKRLPRN